MGEAGREFRTEVHSWTTKCKQTSSLNMDERVNNSEHVNNKVTGMIVYVYSPSTQKASAGGSSVQGKLSRETDTNIIK